MADSTEVGFDPKTVVPGTPAENGTDDQLLHKTYVVSAWDPEFVITVTHVITGDRKRVREFAGKFEFGRDPECHYHIPFGYISRKHCVIALDGNTAVIQNHSQSPGPGGTYARGQKMAYLAEEYLELPATFSIAGKLEVTIEKRKP